MRTNQLLIQKSIGKAKLGLLKDLNNTIPDTPLSQLIPYVAKPEDINVLLNNHSLIKNGKPLEFNGFETRKILSEADRFQAGLFGDQITYPKFIKNHPSLLSFPSELIWLANTNGLSHFKESIENILQKKDIGFDKTKAVKISNRIIELIGRNKETFSFWSDLTSRYESEILSLLLMNITIEMANNLKMRYLSGLVPLIDRNTKSSAIIAHNMNMAYSHVIEDRQNRGMPTPKYFYTICLNQNMIQREDFEDLKIVISNLKGALTQPLFDGIFVSVRGLSKLSNEGSKVATLSKFIDEVNAISQEEAIPVWYSRFGLIGLNILDSGGNFASYNLNLSSIDDVYSVFANNQKNERKSKHGKIFNAHDWRFYDVNQIKKMVIMGKSLKSYPDFPNQPSDIQIEQDDVGRKEFTKPYNLLTMESLNEDWLSKAEKDGEVNHGKEMLRRVDDFAYYTVWGS